MDAFEPWRVERRRYRRFNWPRFEASLDGAVGKTRDWSFGGVRMNLEKPPRNDEAVELVLTDARSGTGRFQAKVVRSSPLAGEAAFRFTEMSEEGIDLLTESMKAFARSLPPLHLR